MIINILLKAELERERKGKREEGFTPEAAMEKREKKIVLQTYLEAKPPLISKEA